MIAPTTRPVWLAALAGLLVAASGALARAEDGGASIDGDLERLTKQLDEYERLSRELTRKYASSQKLPQQSIYSLQSRINDGLVYYQLKEYDRASLLLMEVVQNPDNQSYAGYKDAVFYLAESLYQLKNPIAATQFYLLVLEKNYRQYYRESLIRLIEISYASGHFEDIDKYFAKLLAIPGASSDPEVLYLRAKSQYFRDRFDEAMADFHKVPQGSDYYCKSLYFLGVIHVRRANYKDALESFEGVAACAGDRDEALSELAHLALGRLHYEVGSYSLAINEYQEIGRNSPNYDVALYEMGWTFIKSKQYDQALRAIDILLLSSPDSRLAPDAKLLKGNLELKLGKYAQAQSTFEEIVDRFGPVKDEVRRLISEHADPESYFVQLVGQHRSQFDIKAILPPLAATWVKTEQKVGRALSVVEDLDGAQADIQETVKLITKLEDALYADNAIEIFPDLYIAWNKMMEAENGLILMKQRLLNLERRLIGGRAAPDLMARYEQVREKREQLEKTFMELPKTAQGFAKREATVERRLEEIQVQAFKLGIVIDSIRAQVVAIDKWVADTSRMRGSGSAGAQRVRESVLAQQQELRELQKDLEKLQREIARQKAMVGVGDTVTSAEDDLKRRYEQTLDEEEEVLKELRSGLPPESRGRMERIDHLRARARVVERRIFDFFGTVRKKVQREVAQLRERVAREKKLIERYRRQVVGYKGMGENLAGRIAHASLQNVFDRFDSLVLRADVGIIDVAWQKKENKRKRYEQLLRERKAELEALDREFEPVLEGKL